MAKCKQTGTPNSRPNSFVSVSKPPFPLAFHKPLLIYNCLPLNVVDHNLMQMQMRAWLSCWVGWPELAELRTRYLQTLALGPRLCQRSNKMCGTQSVWHHCSTWCQISDSCAFSKDSVFHSTCSPWLAHAVGNEAGDQSKTSDTLKTLKR